MKLSIILRSWKTSLIGVMSVVLAAVTAYQHDNFIEALKDFRVQIAILGGLLGLLAKDAGVSGPPPSGVTITSTPEVAPIPRNDGPI